MTLSSARTVTTVAAVVLLACAAPAAATGSAAIERVSVTSAGREGAALSVESSITPDGRYVVFTSASSLVHRDPNAARDVYLRDRVRGTTTKVSRALPGSRLTDDSEAASVSRNGRWVAFSSFSRHLVAGVSSRKEQVYLADMRTGQVRLVSSSLTGGAADDTSLLPHVSADGDRVAFLSRAGDLVPGGAPSGGQAVFVRDMSSGTTTRVDVSSAGVQGTGRSYELDLSDDGSKVGFVSASDLTSDSQDGAAAVFIRDLTAGTTSRVSADADAGSVATSPSFSGDASRIAYVDGAGGLVHVRDLTTGSDLAWTAPGDGLGGGTALSADGRHVAFVSLDDTLVPGDTNGVRDVFVHDLGSGKTERVSVGSTGRQSAGSDLSAPSLTGDGSAVAFVSSAGDLVPGDSNGVQDVFVRQH